MTPRHPPAPAGSVPALTRGGTRLHDAFIGAKRTVCGGLVARVAGARHLAKIGLCRRCAAFRRGPLK